MVEVGGVKSQSTQSVSKPFRFGISHLLYGTALIASGLIVAGPLSCLISGGVLFTWWVLSFEDRDGFGALAIFLLPLAVIVGILLPSLHVVRSTPLWMHCQSNKRQCLIALHNFQSANGYLLAAHSLDTDGKPMHSWRVRILPFVDARPKSCRQACRSRCQ